MSGHLNIRDRWRIISLRFDQNISPRQISRIVHFKLYTIFYVYLMRRMMLLNRKNVVVVALRQLF